VFDIYIKFTLSGISVYNPFSRQFDRNSQVTIIPPNRVIWNAIQYTYNQSSDEFIDDLNPFLLFVRVNDVRATGSPGTTP
jgi:hypothetical protein